MTSMVAQGGRWSRGADVAPASADVPTINANRKRLDRDAPNLAFTISSRKRFVEVVLASDRALFDPANASRRTPHSFFASRAFGLTRVDGTDATYIVPVAVVRAFLEAQPRPREIFFTAIAYDDDDGHAPVIASPLAQLVASAPSVPVAADFTVHGLSRSFGMALDRLVRPTEVRSFAANPTVSPTVSSHWQGSGRVEIPAAQAMDEDGEQSFTLGEIDADGFDRDDASTRGATYDDDYDQSYEDPPPPDASDATSSSAASADIDYDDGFGVEDDGDRPAGVEPAELRDDDDGEVAQSYGDEADEDPYARSAANGAPATNGAPPTNGSATPRNGAPPPASVTPPATARRASPPTTAQLTGVLARVAATLDGHSLYTIARRTEAGVRFGVGAFDQASGALGRVLAKMKDADAGAFARIFGDAADELLTVTCAATPHARRANVAGRPLTDDAWLQRLSAAGAHPPFVQAQNDVLVASTLAPLWPTLSGLGLTSDRAIAVSLALGIQMGVHQTAEWLTARLAPAQSDAQVHTALAAVGAPDLESFQRQAGLAASGHVDADTKAALAFALRGLGDSSPLPVPTLAQMLDAIKRHVGHGGAARKIAALMDERSLGDQAR